MLLEISYKGSKQQSFQVLKYNEDNQIRRIIKSTIHFSLRCWIHEHLGTAVKSDFYYYYLCFISVPLDQFHSRIGGGYFQHFKIKYRYLE